MKTIRKLTVAFLLTASFAGLYAQTSPAAEDAPALWKLARSQQAVHRYSTLFTAQDVRDRLSTSEGIASAIDWCRRTGITKVYLEEFRDGYRSQRATLVAARNRFRAAGFKVAGCVTTTHVGKRSTGWNVISCYTDLPTQAKLQSIFEYAASLFDEIMIDDFWFTDCTCDACQAARQARRVTVGRRTYSVPGDTWEDYRRALMFHVSHDCILEAARRVNPKVRIIIKYPQWYDRFQDRGYDVAAETKIFDEIWVGTETRDYTDRRWGGTVQYEGYFIMRWLGGIGGTKCGGGWFDWLGTTPKTYIEQARQTVLAGARESMLFCYGGLHRATGPADVAALRTQIPQLLQTAQQVRRRHPVGLAAYKPPNSHPGKEARVFDFVGMLGLPLVPCHTFPTDARAAFFSVHALKDAKFPSELAAFIQAGKLVLITDGLAQELAGRVPLDHPNVHRLAVRGKPKTLLTLEQTTLDPLRAALLKPFHLDLQAPNRIGFYPFRDGSWVIENFNDHAVTVRLNGKSLQIPARGWKQDWR